VSKPLCQHRNFQRSAARDGGILTHFTAEFANNFGAFDGRFAAIGSAADSSAKNTVSIKTPSPIGVSAAAKA
jgi:hypothetical protein